MFVARKQETVLEAKTRALNAKTFLVFKHEFWTRFLNGALAATKWWVTTQNMSFGPKVVDLMRFGRKTQK